MPLGAVGRRPFLNLSTHWLPSLEIRLIWRFRPTALWSALIVLVQVLTPVQADIHATAQIGGFVVELIDRNPDDGIASTLSLVGGRSFDEGVSFSGSDLSTSGEGYSSQPFSDKNATCDTGCERVSLRC